MNKPSFTRLAERVKALAQTRAFKRVIRLMGFLLTVAVAGYLVSKLTLIGWDKVWDSLPHTPWFYILLLAMFFALPVSEVLIYRVTWNTGVSARHLFLALMNKRVLDKDVLDYSGDMYLYFWAREYVKRPGKEIFHVVKDNIILSSAASTLTAAVLLTWFFALGRVALPKEWLHPGILQVAVVGFCCLLLAVLVIKFRRRIFFLKRKEILAVFGLHLFRLLLVHGLQVIQWIVVMPGIPVSNWLTLLAVQIIIARIPLLPSRDLIFMGAGIEMSSFIAASSPAMAGMLLAYSVINKILNLFFFILVFFSTRKNREPAPRLRVSP